MRVRDHIALSTTGAALLHPLLRRGALGLWAGSVLVDIDHYLWFCLRERRCNPVAAMRFFNEAHPPQDAATRVLHSPAALLAVLLLSGRRRAVLPVALGMALHVALDVRHEVRMNQARAAAMERDDFSCRACGTRASHVGTHLRRQPWLLPSYDAQNLVSLCAPCHAAAHARERGAGAWR
jgi:5-methylcytosine-specific restriction endonuclease McrA